MKEFLIRLVVIYGFIVPFGIVMLILNKNNIIDVNILVGYGIFLYAFIVGAIVTAIAIVIDM